MHDGTRGLVAVRRRHRPPLRLAARADRRRLRRLAASLEAFVGATRPVQAASPPTISSPLTLALVTGRSDGFGFEGFLLDEMLPDVVSSGRESYCACTFAVALGFLHAVETPGAS